MFPFDPTHKRSFMVGRQKEFWFVGKEKNISSESIARRGNPKIRLVQKENPFFLNPLPAY